MNNTKTDDFENKIIEILNKKKEEIYKEIIERLNFEDRKLNLIERVIRIEEELKSHRELIEKLIHQIDKRFEQVDKRFNLLTWIMGIGFTIITSLLIIIMNYIIK